MLSSSAVGATNSTQLSSPVNLTQRGLDRYVHANWDLGEVLAIKDEIVRDNLLVTKLAGPS